MNKSHITCNIFFTTNTSVLVGRKDLLYFTSPSKQHLNLQAGKLYTSLLTYAFYPTFGNELLPATAKSHVVSWNITPGLDYCDIR